MSHWMETKKSVNILHLHHVLTVRPHKPIDSDKCRLIKDDWCRLVFSIKLNWLQDLIAMLNFKTKWAAQFYF